MKILRYIFPILTLISLGSCSDELQSVGEPAGEEGGNTIKVDVTLNVADIAAASSRAFTDKPDYSDLKLQVVEYVLASGPLDGNMFTTNYTDSIKNITTNGDGDVHFSIVLNKTDEPRVLNFIATPKDVELTVPYGLEGTSVPGLTLTDQTPAYWQRVEFPDGYGVYDSEGKWTTNEQVQGKLTHVPMIRNFAKVSLRVADGAGFTLEGFALLNRPAVGTVAPWNTTTMEFPTFLSGDKLLSYSDINATYHGRSPGNQVIEADPATATYNTEAKYLYERPQSSINNPVVIMRGRRNGATASTYYKIDLGYKDENNLFRYYNILRNFEYAITVNAVGADGYDTPQAAMDGVVFNNFSFDINTRQMLNVSNGRDMLWVNQTTFVVTNADQREITLRYRYKKNISNSGGTASNGDIRFLDLETGEAIDNITYGTSDDNDGWRQVTITTPIPTSDRKMQEFVVYDPTTGLGRTITIVVRTPWFYTNAGVWGGNYNYYDQFIFNEKEREEWNGFVSSSTTIGQPLTVRFHIDDNIPEALFPLTFTFESDRQNIENNKIGNLVVVSGPSFFDASKTTIKYVKTVTWADYNSELTHENQTATIVDDDNDGITSHVVRARFQTILPISTEQWTTIYVYNPYIRVQGSESDYLEVRFRGKEGTAPDYDLTDPTTPTE